MRPLPPQQELLRLFAYDAETGVLSWRVRRGHNPAWICAGSVASHGYLNVGVKGTTYPMHRVIWKLMTGKDPVGFVDHRDGDRQNNQWENLRDVTPQQNAINRAVRCDNKTGVSGICWDNESRKWRVVIVFRRTRYDLGRFRDFDTAARVATEARRRLHCEFASSR